MKKQKSKVLLILLALGVIIVLGYFLLAYTHAGKLRNCINRCSTEQCRNNPRRAKECVRLCTGVHDTLAKQKQAQCRAVFTGSDPMKKRRKPYNRSS